MTHYTSNTTLDQVAGALEAAEDVVVTTHAKPDGDALGSLVALAAALEQKGKRVRRWVIPPVLESLRMLAEQGPVDYITEQSEPDEAPEPDRIVVLDTGAWGQLEALQPWLEQRYEKTIVVDHHLRGDDVGALRYVDSDAAAASEIVAELVDLLGAEVTQRIATGLYVGIASDTGWFRFSNTRARTHELAARLFRAGVDHAGLYKQLEQTERHEKLQLLNRALESLQLVADGHAAVMTLRLSDFEDTGAMQEETERLVDVPQIVGNVQAVVLMSETPEGEVRISFRSKPGNVAVDANKLAQAFGGGGHARAAGARVREPLEPVRRRIIDLLERAFREGQLMPADQASAAEGGG
jgi:phosphoesterase RecJ-like protein